MKKKPAIVGALIFVAIVAFVVYSTVSTPRRRVEVCIAFNGRNQCRIASGATEEFAIRTATTNACALLSSGVTDTVNCERTPPTSVKWLDR